jgi:hypothetical protein
LGVFQLTAKGGIVVPFDASDGVPLPVAASARHGAQKDDAVVVAGKAFSGIELEGDAAAQGSDFEVLENLRRLAFSDRVDEPKQLDLWREEAAA